MKRYLPLAILTVLTLALAWVAVPRADAAVLPGDINGDNKVDVVDLSMLLTQYGSAGSADVNGNGTVDITDLSILLSNYGKTGTGQIISENFSSGAGGFVGSGGTWAVTGGQYQLSLAEQGDVFAGLTSRSLHNTQVSGDFTLNAKGSVLPAGADWKDFGIIFGYQDPNNYYYAVFNEQNNTTTNGLFKRVNGTSQELADFGSTITAGNQYAIRIERAGGAIRVYRNNALVGSATDSTFSSGKVGFGSVWDSCLFDDLVVTSGAPTPSPTATPSPTPAPSPTPTPNPGDIIFNGDLSPGNFSQWSPQFWGELNIVTSPKHPRFPYAASMKTTQPVGDGTRRVHLHSSNFIKDGDVIFHGYSVYLPSPGFIDGLYTFIGHQLLWEVYGEPWDLGAPVSLNVPAHNTRGDTFYVGIVDNRNTADSSVGGLSGGVIHNIPATRNVWHDFVFEIKHSKTGSGYVRVWHRIAGQGAYQRLRMDKGPYAGQDTHFAQTMHTSGAGSRVLPSNYHGEQNPLVRHSYVTGYKAARTFEAAAP